jgi:hypothetical protein
VERIVTITVEAQAVTNRRASTSFYSE